MSIEYEHSPQIIKGVTITELKQFSDSRGSVLRMLRNDDPEFVSFGECYFSEIHPGVIKAWKFHLKQTQLFAVPVGRIKLVIFDDRKGSISKGNIQVIHMGRPDAYFRVTIPPGLWYGFCCKSKVSALLVNCSDMPHNSEESKVKLQDDKLIPYKWK